MDQRMGPGNAVVVSLSEVCSKARTFDAEPSLFVIVVNPQPLALVDTASGWILGVSPPKLEPMVRW